MQVFYRKYLKNIFERTEGLNLLNCQMRIFNLCRKNFLNKNPQRKAAGLSIY